jgi:hypothetical protein
MIQQYSGQFRAGGQQPIGGGPALNAIDYTNTIPGTVPQRTLGSGLLDATVLQPPLISNWAIQSVSVSAAMFLYKNPAAAVPYGRLGRVLAGIQIYGSPSQDEDNPTFNLASPIPGASPMPPLPQDSSLLTPLWNPDVDPLPPLTAFVFQDISTPQNPPAPALLPVLATINLNQPLFLSSIGQLLVGLWLTPSLLSCGTNGYPCVQLGVANALYTINCDDSRQSLAPSVIA